MDKIHFSLPIVPSTAGEDVAKFDLTVEKVCAGPLVLNSKPKLSGDFIAWCLQLILGDQYTKGDVAGSWSKRYPEYGRFILGETVRESITVSGCIAEALVKYSEEFRNDKIAKAIVPRLDLLKDYLKRHYDHKRKGVGIRPRPPKRGHSELSINIRHNTWAVIALWHLIELGIEDSETQEMLRSVAGSIKDSIGSLDSNSEWACTYSALHKLLTTNGLADFVMTSDRSRRSALKRIEGVIIDKFDAQYGSWDPDDLKKDPKVSIDTALGVLGDMQISSCIDNECSEVLRKALGHLCEESLITLDDKTMALPFYEGGEADIGATIELLWCIIKNQDVFKPEKGVVKKMIKFIVNPSNRKGKLRFAYPWNLSSALLIATKSIGDTNMYIKKIVLDNVRCFKRVEFDLSSGRDVQKWGVILGDNGVGKTTLLRSVAIGLSDETGANALLQDTYGDWVRWGEKKATIRIDLLEGRKQYSIETTIRHETDSKLETLKQVRFPDEDFPWERMFVCGYGANRSILGNETYEKYSLADAIYTLIWYRAELQNPELMLRRRAVTEEEIAEVCGWLNEVLMLRQGATKLDEGGIKIKGAWGRSEYIGSIGDGYAATITLVLDMLGWATLKGLKDQKNELSGIILIDEIEQHLHPKWQRNIIRLLHKVFPNIQFIASSHSPLCAAGLADLADESVSLVLLTQFEKGHVRSESLSTMRGWRYDEILRSPAFSTPDRNVITEELMNKIHKLYMRKKLTSKEKVELKELLEELEKQSPLGKEAAERRRIIAELDIMKKKLKMDVEKDDKNRN